MKKNMQPVFEAAWWNTNQPKGLPSAKDLRTALIAYEAARQALLKSGAAADLKPAATAFDKVKSAVDGVIAEAEKMRKGAAPKGVDPADLEATVEVLKKCAKMYAPERTALEAMVSADEEEEGNAFTDPAKYKKYLLGSLRKLMGGEPLNFGLVLGAEGSAHRMALSKTKGPAGLAKMAADATGLNVRTFGLATLDTERPGTLILALEGKQLPGLKKKADKMLRAFKPLPFTEVVLWVDGVEVADLPDPNDTDADETGPDATAAGTAPPAPPAPSAAAPAAPLPPAAAALNAGMERLVPAIRQVITNAPQRREEIMVPVNAFKAQMAAQDYAGAKQSLTDVVTILKAPGAAPSASAPPPAGTAQTAATALPYSQLIADWATARTGAANDLRQLEAAILDQFKDAPELPSIRQGVRRLDTILATLGTELQDRLNAALAAPADARPQLHKDALAEVARYRGYVASDALVAAVESNPFTPVSLKATVSATLDQIESALAA